MCIENNNLVYDSYDIYVVEFIGGDGKPFEEHDYYDSEIEYETFNISYSYFLNE